MLGMYVSMKCMLYIGVYMCASHNVNTGKLENYASTV